MRMRMKWKNTAALAILLMVCLMLDACGASAFVGGKNDETALKETSQIATQSVQHTDPLTVVTEAVKATTLAETASRAEAESRAAEESRKAAEAASRAEAESRAAEESRKAAEAESRAAEESRKAAEAAKKAEEERKAEESRKAAEEAAKQTAVPERSGPNYIANKNSMKFHYPSCPSVKRMKEENKWYFYGTRDELIRQGYDPCHNCKP